MIFYVQAVACKDGINWRVDRWLALSPGQTKPVGGYITSDLARPPRRAEKWMTDFAAFMLKAREQREAVVNPLLCTACHEVHHPQYGLCDARCAVCGWPLESSLGGVGCERGNCSLRPPLKLNQMYDPVRAQLEGARRYSQEIQYALRKDDADATDIGERQRLADSCESEATRAEDVHAGGAGQVSAEDNLLLDNEEHRDSATGEAEGRARSGDRNAELPEQEDSRLRCPHCGKSLLNVYIGMDLAAGKDETVEEGN